MNRNEIKAKIKEAMSVFDDVNIINIIKDYVVENYGEEKLIRFNDDGCTICETDAVSDYVRYINGIVVVDNRLILYVTDDRYDCTAFNEAVLKGDKREHAKRLQLPLTSFIAILENITNEEKLAVIEKEEHRYFKEFIECYYNNKKDALLDESKIVSYWA